MLSDLSISQEIPIRYATSGQNHSILISMYKYLCEVALIFWRNTCLAKLNSATAPVDFFEYLTKLQGMKLCEIKSVIQSPKLMKQFAEPNFQADTREFRLSTLRN